MNQVKRPIKKKKRKKEAQRISTDLGETGSDYEENFRHIYSSEY